MLLKHICYEVDDSDSSLVTELSDIYVEQKFFNLDYRDEISVEDVETRGVYLIYKGNNKEPYLNCDDGNLDGNEINDDDQYINFFDFSFRTDSVPYFGAPATPIYHYSHKRAWGSKEEYGLQLANSILYVIKYGYNMHASRHKIEYQPNNRVIPDRLVKKLYFEYIEKLKYNKSYHLSLPKLRRIFREIDRFNLFLNNSIKEDEKDEIDLYIEKLIDGFKVD